MNAYRTFNPVRRAALTQMERESRRTARAKSLMMLTAVVCFAALALFF